jgi:hypothetical protein
VQVPARALAWEPAQGRGQAWARERELAWAQVPVPALERGQGRALEPVPEWVLDLVPVPAWEQELASESEPASELVQGPVSVLAVVGVVRRLHRFGSWGRARS